MKRKSKMRSRLPLFILSLALFSGAGCGALGGKKGKTAEPERRAYQLGGRDEEQGWLREKWSRMKAWEDRKAAEWRDRMLRD